MKENNEEPGFIYFDFGCVRKSQIPIGESQSRDTEYKKHTLNKNAILFPLMFTPISGILSQEGMPDMEKI